jgi:hypothetical protein
VNYLGELYYAHRVRKLHYADVYYTELRNDIDTVYDDHTRYMVAGGSSSELYAAAIVSFTLYILRRSGFSSGQLHAVHTTT